jgi:hypothetical protein
MSAMVLGFSQRGRIAFALSLFFISAAYYLWSGGHESLITTPPVGGAPKNGENDNDNHHDVLMKTFAPTSTSSATPQATPVHIDDGTPTTNVIMDEFDETPIRELCAQTSWASSADVVINCEGRVGGVGMICSILYLHRLDLLLTQPAAGNVRQEILVCVRHAIEIGASLIRPTIMLRSDGLIEYQHGPIYNMSYMFDLEKFDARLRSACPLLPLYEDLRAVEKHGRPMARVARPWDLPKENGEPITPKTWAEMNRQGDGKITVIDMPLIMGQTCRLSLP